METGEGWLGAPEDGLNEDSRRDFLEAAESDEDLVAVLRGHVYVEQDLENLILDVIPNAEPLLGRMSFDGKLNAARDMNLLSQAMARSLGALDKLRDSFAHALGRRQLTEHDDANMLEALAEEARGFYDVFAGMGEDNRDGAVTRIVIAAIRAHMQVLGINRNPARYGLTMSPTT